MNGYYFNGPKLIARKAQLAMELGLGGVMIWEVRTAQRRLTRLGCIRCLPVLGSASHSRLASIASVIGSFVPILPSHHAAARSAAHSSKSKLSREASDIAADKHTAALKNFSDMIE